METYNEKTKIYEQFSNGTTFKSALNLDQDIARSVLFENGKHWRTDKDIEEYPKITLNVIKQIGKARQSNILQNEYSYLINSTNFKSIRKIQDFLKYLADVAELKRKDLKALKDDYIKGTAIGYFFWDAEKRGFLHKSGGNMRYEIIDIRRLVVASPYITEIQDQEWIIYNTTETIATLKEKYGDKEYVADGNLYTSSTETNPVAMVDDDERVNVYTKFYRNEDGEVLFEIATQYQTLKKATPSNPFFKSKTKKEMPNTAALPDEKENDPRIEEIWNLYPFVRLCLNERDNCFYGIPITLEYIEAQKSINNHFSIYDKALQDNVLGGWVFRKGVLDGVEVTTESGQMIELDTLPNESINNVFNRLPVANIPQDSQRYSASLSQMVREVAGTPNVQLGMSDHSGQSGKQTQLLLDRAKENTTDNAMIFNEFKKDQAKIMWLFAKFYYDNEDFVAIDHGVQEDNVRSYKGDNKFNGTEYLKDDIVFYIKVGAAPSFSEYTNLEMLSLMVQSGQLPFESFADLTPDGYISNKQEVRNTLAKNSKKIIEQLQKQVEEASEIIKQMSEGYKKAQKDLSNIDIIIQENTRLKSMMAEVSANAIKKVNESNKEVTQATEDVKTILNAIQK